MALDARYFTSIVLQQVFRDKDTGLPLSSGVVKFWRDSARNVPKDVFSLSGSPPNYTYVNEGPEITLTDTGVFDKAYYYYPYDANGDVDLYFVDWYSATNVLQDSREAWPNVVGTSEESSDVQNYAPNGQFLLHNDIPATTTEEQGQIRADITDIAYGGWTFERSTGSTATDFILFPRYGSYASNPQANPRYAMNVSRTVAGLTDVQKDVCLTFSNVNRFASTTQKYTVGFEAQSNSGSTLSLQLLLIKNYGTGGSPTTTTTLTTFSVTTSLNTYEHSFTFGDNSTKTIGPNDDDYVQIVLRPTGVTTWDYTFTDFGMIFGEDASFVYPEATNRQTIYRSLTPGVPAYDNSNLALPLILNSAGLTYDTSVVGKIFQCVYSTPGYGELLCDGVSYLKSGYSSDLIPYSRLASVLFNVSANAYLFGGGSTYLNSYLVSGGSELVIGNNAFGAATATNAGTSGFTVATIHPASVTTYGVLAAVNTSNVLFIQNKEYGAVANSGAATSTFTVSQVLNNGVSRAVTSVTTQPATGLAGLYFTFQSLIATVATNFYVWFKVNGVGADPAPGGTGIEVDLNTADTAAQVAFKIQLALTGGLTSTIVFPAASGVTAGTDWTFNTPAQGYYVWYQKDGVGTDPAVANRLGILVNVATGDTAAQVAFKTQTSVNQMYFGTPDTRGLFFRAFDSTATVDVEGTARLSSVPGLSGNKIGAIQFDQFQSHTHGSNAATPVTGTTLGGANEIDLTAATISAAGGVESRGLNMAVNYVIKY